MLGEVREVPITVRSKLKSINKIKVSSLGFGIEQITFFFFFKCCLWNQPYILGLILALIIISNSTHKYFIQKHNRNTILNRFLKDLKIMFHSYVNLVCFNTINGLFSASLDILGVCWLYYLISTITMMQLQILWAAGECSLL